jgi:hypothetical protein
MQCVERVGASVGDGVGDCVGGHAANSQSGAVRATKVPSEHCCTSAVQMTGSVVVGAALVGDAVTPAHPWVAGLAAQYSSTVWHTWHARHDAVIDLQHTPGVHVVGDAVVGATEVGDAEVGAAVVGEVVSGGQSNASDEPHLLPLAGSRHSLNSPRELLCVTWYHAAQPPGTDVGSCVHQRCDGSGASPGRGSRASRRPARLAQKSSAVGDAVVGDAEVGAAETGAAVVGAVVGVAAGALVSASARMSSMLLIGPLAPGDGDGSGEASGDGDGWIWSGGHGGNEPKPQKRQSWCTPPALQPRPPSGSPPALVHLGSEADE